MIFGTSKIRSKSGPGYLLIVTNMLQKIQDKLWNHPGNILFLSIWASKKFGNFREHVCPKYHLCSICPFLFFRFLWTDKYICWKYFNEDEDWKMINFPLMKSTKAWIWFSYLSKTWTESYPKLFCFQGGAPKLFYFQER